MRGIDFCVIDFIAVKTEERKERKKRCEMRECEGGYSNVSEGREGVRSFLSGCFGIVVFSGLPCGGSRVTNKMLRDG